MLTLSLHLTVCKGSKSLKNLAFKQNVQTIKVYLVRVGFINPLRDVELWCRISYTFSCSSPAYISSILSWNSEANASEFLENIEEIFTIHA